MAARVARSRPRGDAFDHATGAAAGGARLVSSTSGAAAVPTEVLTRTGGSGRCLIAGIHRLRHEIRSVRRRPFSRLVSPLVAHFHTSPLRLDWLPVASLGRERFGPHALWSISTHPPQRPLPNSLAITASSSLSESVSSQVMGNETNTLRTPD